MRKSLFLLVLIMGLVSCEDILEVTDISEQEVTLLAPTNGSIVTDSLVSFNWNGIEEANSYLIQVATPNFGIASQLVLDSIITIDSSFVGTRLTKMLSNSEYEWRVKALNSDFETDFSQSEFVVETTSN